MNHLFIRILLIFIILLLVWQFAVLLLALPQYILPGPWEVLKSFWLNRTLIFINALPTLMETLSGLFLGSLAGIWMALCLSYFRWTRPLFLPLMITSQALPAFAIAPLLVIWFGYGMSSKVVVAIVMIFFPVASAFYDGLLHTQKDWLHLAHVMGASRWRILWRIRIPAALPELGSGLRVAVTFAPMGAVIGEWVGSSKGLGYLMLNANARMQIDLMFAVLLTLVLFTLILYFTVDSLLKKFIFWQ